jgi:hypothetical protein
MTRHLAVFFFLMTMILTRSNGLFLRGQAELEAKVEIEREEINAYLRHHHEMESEFVVDVGHEMNRFLSSESDDENEIYNAGSVNLYNNAKLNTLLRGHKYLGFTKKWRGTDRLILTTRCKISGSSIMGAYYCVEGRTMCVTSRSMHRFYGQHVGGGPCSLLPLDDDVVDSLPDALLEAYKNTCDGDSCDGRK